MGKVILMLMSIAVGAMAGYRVDPVAFWHLSPSASPAFVLFAHWASVVGGAALLVSIYVILERMCEHTISYHYKSKSRLT